MIEQIKGEVYDKMQEFIAKNYSHRAAVELKAELLEILDKYKDEENKVKVLWLDNLLDENLRGAELYIRKINGYCDELRLHYRITRHPLSIDSKGYELQILKLKQDKYYLIHKDDNMELEVLLKKSLKWFKEYYEEHREIRLTKGGVEFI